MHGEIENWNNGWFGVSLGLSAAEIERLIALLTKLRDDPDQHFHISSNYVDSGGLGDIEIHVQSSNDTNNMSITGPALAPGNGVPSTGT